LHQVGDLFELNVKLRYQKVNYWAGFLRYGIEPSGTIEFKVEISYSWIRASYYELVEVTNKMKPCNRIYYSKNLLKVQHVSRGIPLIIRSSKMYLQPLVYIPMWVQ